MNNRLSTKNSLLYKLKCINSRCEEFTPLDNNKINKTERYK